VLGIAERTDNAHGLVLGSGQIGESAMRRLKKFWRCDLDISASMIRMPTEGCDRRLPSASTQVGVISRLVAVARSIMISRRGPPASGALCKGWIARSGCA